MSRSTRAEQAQWVQDILTRIVWTRDALAGVDYEEFATDHTKAGAVSYFLLVIGEAANRLGDAAARLMPDQDWARIVGFRNVAAHGYDAIDPRRLWMIATNLDGLERDCELALQKLVHHRD